MEGDLGNYFSDIVDIASLVKVFLVCNVFLPRIIILERNSLYAWDKENSR